MSEDPPRPELDEPPHLPPKRWGCGQWFLVGFLAFLAHQVFGYWYYSSVYLYEIALQNQAANNCRMIIISLGSYAADHGGKYPDGATANDAFRQLIKEGLLEDERIFTAPYSPYVGDNNLGKAPEYAQALRSRENHWAMTKGLTDDSPGDWPLVFENPALSSWPPKWDSRLVDVAEPGRVWNDDKIIVGRNDGSVEAERLAKDGSPFVTVEPIKGGAHLFEVPGRVGKTLFELAGPHEILDVAR